LPTYLTRNTAAVAVVVVSAKRDVVTNNMKLTKERLKQIIKEEYDSTYLTNSDEIAGHILDYKLDKTFEDIKSGMEQLMKSDDADTVIDAYDDLKEVTVKYFK
jgi:glycyl-tRNA synthetase beta subunit